MRVTVPSLAKLNLDLRVLHKRADGYHELRSIFQTISLQDTLSIEFDFAKRTQIDLASSVDIPDNLVVRAAAAVLDHLKVRAWVRFALRKQIPMGAGLGGGSSNAAAVLATLPALAGKRVSMSELVRIAESLGSDVPFFLYGGTAIGVGRGSELYPLPDTRWQSAAVVVSTGVHVSTAEAYRALGRTVTSPLTSPDESPILREFQTIAWSLARPSPASPIFEQLRFRNDFEEAVFKAHPELVASIRKLRRRGARPALLTGSGSAVFGVFRSLSEASGVAGSFPPGTAFPVRFVTRRRFRKMWTRALGPAAGMSCFAE